ncbi:hypothetical protein JIN84_15760 [Luteolibacter yonseiensis]|uniref:Uncharacterized protein n=1 Tax=Luteolibacter yonseiensis TaxID=1144680 RepID=A0A934R7W2_9BACT|nr:thrombospondin type 3 repeat-containing protein [Luteolibacter yonseiensis]MBK1817080.1 hypothetical protein [Luteolibacter yonseiensis]
MNLFVPSSRKLLSAVVGSLLSVQAAFAAIVPAPVSGDIFLAFRASGGTGGSQSYIVNLGTDANFRNATTSFTVTGLGNIGADLTEIYGPGWSSRGDLFWGIFAARVSTSSIIYGSRERNPVTSVSPAWSLIDTTSRNTTAGQISSVIDSIGGYRGREATANSPVAAVQPNTGEASSYNKQVASAGTKDFGSLSEWSSIEGDFGSGPAGTALDLYRIAGASGVTRVGHFTISAEGVVQFNIPTVTPPVDVDTDGDGFLDSQEALAGTNPNDASDFFRIQSLQRSAGGTGVAFKTIPGSSYQIYYSENLAAGSWVRIATVTGGASPTLHQYLDDNLDRRARAKGFYKVSVGN